ncbi:MAG: SRPBCC family protein [Myxococcota bacterium]
MSRAFTLSLLLTCSACASAPRSFTITHTFPFAADTVFETSMAHFGDNHLHPHIHHVEYLDGAEGPAVGVRREVWMSEDGSQRLHEELTAYDPETRSTRLRIIHAENVPIDTSVSEVQSRVTPIDADSSTLTMTMTYKMTPPILGVFAESGIRSDLEDFMIGFEHYLHTGEEITAERFNLVEANYR